MLLGSFDLPHWGRVRHLLSFLPHQFRLQTIDLKFLSPMARKRLFLLFQLVGAPMVVPHVDLKPKHWLEAGCGFLDATSLEDQMSLLRRNMQFALLSAKQYLPLQERTKSFQCSEIDGEKKAHRTCSAYSCCQLKRICAIKVFSLGSSLRTVVPAHLGSLTTLRQRACWDSDSAVTRVLGYEVAG